MTHLLKNLDVDEICGLLIGAYLLSLLVPSSLLFAVRRRALHAGRMKGKEFSATFAWSLVDTGTFFIEALAILCFTDFVRMIMAGRASEMFRY